MRSLPIIDSSGMPEFSGSPAGENRRAAVVASRFNESITQRLVDGAFKEFDADRNTLIQPEDQVVVKQRLF